MTGAAPLAAGPAVLNRARLVNSAMRSRCTHVSHVQGALILPDLDEALKTLGQLQEFPADDATAYLRAQALGALRQVRRQRIALPPARRKVVESEIERLTADVPGCMSFGDGRAATLVIFMGAAGKAQGLPLRMFHWLVRDLPANVVYLRDERDGAYLSGIPGLGTTPAADAQALHARLLEIGTRRAITIGFSIGSFAAALHGALLALPEVACFGPMLSLDKDFLRKLPEFKRRLPMARKQLARLPTAPDVLQLLRTSPATTVHVYYGDACARDLRHLAPAEGVDNIVRHPIAGVTQQGIGLRMMADGSFRRVLKQLLRSPRFLASRLSERLPPAAEEKRQ